MCRCKSNLDRVKKLANLYAEKMHEDIAVVRRSNDIYNFLLLSDAKEKNLNIVVKYEWTTTDNGVKLEIT